MLKTNSVTCLQHYFYRPASLFRIKLSNNDSGASVDLGSGNDILDAHLASDREQQRSGIFHCRRSRKSNVLSERCRRTRRFSGGVFHASEHRVPLHIGIQHLSSWPKTIAMESGAESNHGIARGLRASLHARGVGQAEVAGCTFCTAFQYSSSLRHVITRPYCSRRIPMNHQPLHSLTHSSTSTSKSFCAADGISRMRTEIRKSAISYNWKFDFACIWARHLPTCT
jgi:hypothetical protein